MPAPRRVLQEEPGQRGEKSMNDNVTDDALIDVGGLGLAELLAEVDESSLARALRRILAASEEGVAQYGFQQHI
jgi:FXSXX-COOH protein